jgi:F-type H+-transporting ATPase subunit epsilon
MEKSLQLEIVTPDKVVLSEQVDYVGAPGYYKAGGKTRYAFVSGGFAEVSDNKVTILAESAERAEDIDIERARKAQQRAEERLKAEREKIDATRAEAALKRALARLQVRNAA